MQPHLKQINAGCLETNREVRSIRGIGGRVLNKMFKSKYSEAERQKYIPPDIVQEELDASDEDETPFPTRKKTIVDLLAEKKMNEEKTKNQDTFLHLIEDGQFDQLSTDSQFKVRETEQTISSIQGVVGDLKAMALQMGETIDEHNDMIEALNEESARTNVHLNRARKQVRRAF